MEKKGGIKAARPRGGTISASWSAGRTNAAAQGIVKPAWADASVERGLASQWPRFGARVVALWVSLGVGSTKADAVLAPRIRNWKESNALRRSPLGGKQGHGEFQVVERDWADLGWVAVFASRAARVPNFRVLVGLETPWSEDPASSVDPGPALGCHPGRTNCMETTEICWYFDLSGRETISGRGRAAKRMATRMATPGIEMHISQDDLIRKHRHLQWDWPPCRLPAARTNGNSADA